MILDDPVAPVPGDPDAVLAGWVPSPDPARSGSDLVLVQCCAWTLVWLSVVALGLTYWGSWSAGAWAALLAPVVVLTGLVGAALVWTGRPGVSSAMQHFGLVAGLATAALVEGTGIHMRRFYTTDSAAFNQVATRQLLDGHDPYTASMAAAARLLHPASSFWTYQVSGAHTLKVSYPAGSFLLQAPRSTQSVTRWFRPRATKGAWRRNEPAGYDTFRVWAPVTW